MRFLVQEAEEVGADFALIPGGGGREGFFAC